MDLGVPTVEQQKRIQFLIGLAERKQKKANLNKHSAKYIRLMSEAIGIIKAVKYIQTGELIEGSNEKIST